MFLDWFLLIVTTLIGSLLGKQAPTGASSAPVPQLVNYPGKATDAQGGPIAGIAGITFSIYKDVRWRSAVDGDAERECGREG
jgi:hypothetical protein